MKDTKTVVERKCEFEGCGRKHYGKGWCHQHYSMVVMLGKTPRAINNFKGPKPKEGCSFPGCTRKHYAKGWCRGHYHIVVTKGGEPRPILNFHGRRPTHICSVEGCNKIAKSNGYCPTHDSRFGRHGDPLIVLKRGVKSKGGHQQYPNHSLLKRNRLIKLTLNPICEVCHKNPSKITHHRDGLKINHNIENLEAVCGMKCHHVEHTKLKIQKKIENLLEKCI